MFEDSGSQLKTVASVLFLILVVCSVIFGVWLMANINFMLGLIVLVLFAVFSYMQCLVLAAFGDLVAKSEENAENTRKIYRQMEAAHIAPDSTVEITEEQVGNKKTARVVPISEEVAPVNKAVQCADQKHLKDIQNQPSENMIFDPDKLILDISEMTGSREMMNHILRLSSNYTGVFSEVFLKKLEDTVAMGRMYGDHEAAQNFIRDIKQYFGKE